MEKIVYEAKVMWSQLDANMHLRHSAYSDFATQGRLELMELVGLGINNIFALKIGPVLFREEIQYLKEVKPDDTVKVTCSLQKMTADGARWTFVQKLYKDEHTLAAVVVVDGAWIDLEKRKLCTLPDKYIKTFEQIEKTEDFKLFPSKTINNSMNKVSPEFEAAMTKSKQLSSTPENDVLLQIYALYKQATVGDAPKDGDYNMFDFKAKFKHEAWLKLQGMESEEAQAQYIALINQLSK